MTEADLASQQAIENFLREKCPDHEFLGEEDPDLSLLQSAETLWVVDPLDGTTNYVHGMNAFAVSVALVTRGQPIVGVIYDPVSGECFYASRGGGAWLRNGGSPIRLAVSDISEIDHSLIAASFPTTVIPGSAEELRFLDVLRVAQAVRRIGAAALNLAYVAAGRLDAYWATNVKAWDVAAGFLLVEEAGAVLTHLDGSAAQLPDPQFATATPGLFEAFKTILDRHE